MTIFAIAVVISLLTVSLSGSFATTTYDDDDDDSNFIDPNWIKPGLEPILDHLIEEGYRRTCPPVSTCAMPVQRDGASCDQETEKNRPAFAFYRKLVMEIFNENRLQQQAEGEYKWAKAQFKINDGQLRKLKDATTARDIDAIVSDIVEQTEDVRNRFGDVSCAFSRERTVGLFIGASVLVTFVLVTRFRYPKLYHGSLWMMVKMMVLVVAFIVVYIQTRQECNSKLELELRIFKNRADACVKQASTNPWITPLSGKDIKVDCLEPLWKQYEQERTSCRPLEVLLHVFEHLETFGSRLNFSGSWNVQIAIACTAFVCAQWIVYILLNVTAYYKRRRPARRDL